MQAIRIKNSLYLLTLVCALHTGLIQAKTISESFEVSAGGLLDLRTDVGSIEIDTHQQESIELTASIKGFDDDEFEVNYQVEGGNLIVRGERQKRSGWGYNRRVKFSLTVPKSFNLKLDTSGGSIEIQDLNGDIDAHTSGGSISVGDIQGEVKLDTSGGSIDVDSVSGPINARTSGGSIEVTISEQLTEDSILKTSGGHITAVIPADMRLNIDASTSGGRVDSEFDIDGRTTKRSVRGAINGGGPELTLRTSGGGIDIETR